MRMTRTIVAMTVAFVTAVAHAGDSAPFPLDTVTSPVVNDTLSVSWDAAWIGGDTNATVVIADNGTEVRRVTGEGEFTYTLTGVGRHDLTYTTYIGEVAQEVVYSATVFKDWKYEVREGGAVITGTTHTEGDVAVPSEIDGYSVTEIDGAFVGCSGLTSVTILDGVTNIGDYAFSNCSGLASVTIPSSVTSIGDMAFYGCSGLTSVFIDDLAAWCRISFVGGFASPLQFAHNLYLNGELVTDLTIPDGVTSIGDGAFSSCSGLTSVTIPVGVTSIGEGAFNNCSGLTSVTIPDSVTNIGASAFNNCSGLTSLAIPDSVMSIGSSVFNNCSGLTSMRIPEGVTSIGANAFDGCVGLTNLVIESENIAMGKSGLKQAKFNTRFDRTSSLEDSDEVSDVSGVIAAYQKVTSSPWQFSDPVTGATYAWNAQNSTFAYFGEMYMEAGKTYVFGAHFDDDVYVNVGGQVLINVSTTSQNDLHTGKFSCPTTGWYYVEFRLGDNYGGKGSWGNKWGLDFGLGYRDDGGTSTTQSEWKRLIDPGDASLLRCGLIAGINLKSITMPWKLVTQMRVSFPDSYDKLETITLTGDPTAIPDHAFEGCAALRAIDIPSTVTNIGTCAFAGCSGLTSLAIPDSVTSIGANAFDGCVGLTNLVVESENIAMYRSGLKQAKFNTRFDTTSSLGDSDEVSYVSGVIAAYQKVTSSPWQFSDPVTGATYAWNEQNSTFAYFGEMYMEAGKTYVFGAHFDNDAYVKVGGKVLINVQTSSSSFYTGSFICATSGWYAVEFRLGDDGGGKGSWGYQWGVDFGLGYRDDGGTSTTQSEWKRLIDPGDASLLRCDGGIAGINLKSMKSITMPWKLVTQMRATFPYSYDKLETITLTGDSTEVPAHAFEGCAALRAIDIPSTVTDIGMSAFAACRGLTSVTIPDSVTSIGTNAFDGCVGLTNLVIESENTSFYKSGLRQAKFNTRFDTVSSLEDSDEVSYVSGVIAAYQKVTSSPWQFSDPVTGATYAWNAQNSTFAYFGEMYMKAGNTYVFGAHFDDDVYVNVGGQVLINVSTTSLNDLHTGKFSCPTTGWYYVEFRLGDKNGGKGSWGNKWGSNFGLGYRDDGGTSTTQSEWKRLIDPGDASLLRCDCGIAGINLKSMKSITMPWKLVTQMRATFPYSYDKLETITLTGDPTVIPDYTFEGCAALRAIDIPSTVTNIGTSAFAGCSGLTSVTIPDSVTSIGASAFSGCSGLTSVTIPDSVMGIGASAFQNCSGLTSVTIPDGVTSIGTNAFDGCSGIKDLTVPQYVLDLRINSIFPTYNSITNVAYSSVITNIGTSTFNGCGSLLRATIPDTAKGIGPDAFYNCTSLGEVYIGNSVTNIGDYTFYNCSRLTSVTIPVGVINIGAYAFSGCSGLTSVTIPNSVTSIGNNAFYGCRGVTSVMIPNSVTSIGASAFSGCSNVHEVTVPGWKCEIPFGNVTNLVISEGTTSVRNNAFSGCSGLTSVTIPSSVTSIGTSAFRGCSGLTSVTIPDSVTDIGDYAFYNCNGLTNLTIPDSVTSIGTSAFRGCSGITSLVIGSGVTSVGEEAFFGCEGLTSVTIPNSVTSIGASAFRGCSGLTSIVIGSGMTSIGSSAFYGCSGLTSVTIPAGVTSIGANAFYGCSGLTGVTIPAGVTSIGANAFYGCSGLTGVTIPAGVTSIGANAFYGCSGLTGVTIGNGVTSIGSSAFSGCSNVQEVTVPGWKCEIPFGNVTNLVISEGTTSVKTNAFSDCGGIMNVSIPNSVTSIGYSAFCNCSGLTSVTIPDSVTNLENYAFQGCTGLRDMVIGAGVAVLPVGLVDGCAALTNLTFMSEDTSLGDNDLRDLMGLYGAQPDGYWVVQKSLVGYKGVCPPTVPDLDDLVRVMPGALNGCTSLTDLTFSVEARLTTIGTNAFKGCTELQSVTLPQCLEEIGDEAFMGCSYLENVIVPGSVRHVGARAFKNCTGFTAAQIEHGVESLGDEAFYGDWRIAEVDIPSTVTNIGVNAFGGDSSIIRVGLRGDVRPVSEIFSTYASIREATVKEGTGPIVADLFRACSQLRDVHFFGNCPSLLGVDIYDGTDSALTTYVARDSTGWDGTPGSHALPRSWPLSGSYRRAIAWWDVPTYLVVFDSNGGTLGVQETYQQSEHMFVLPPEPVQTGYTFVGWWTKPTGGLRVTSETVFIEGVYTRLYAHWMKEYRVILDPNGGTVTNDYVTYLDQTVYGILPTAVRTGYAFMGWRYAGRTILPGTHIVTRAEHTLTAHWEACQYSIRFDPNGGTGEMAEQPMVYDMAAPLASNRFAKENLLFCGWATEADGPVEYRDGASVTNLSAVADDVVTLYAVWQEKPMEVLTCEDAFGGAGVVTLEGDGNVVVTLTNDVNGTVEIPDDIGNVTIDLNGHDITGSAGGAAIRIMAGEGVAQGGATQLTIEDTSAGEKGQVMGGGDAAGIEIAEDAAPSVRLEVEDAVVVLNGDGTEQWKVNQYTVTFEANGGVGGESEKLAFGTEIVVPTVTREGYTFSGWSPVVAATVSARDMTYTAQWKANRYTVTFNSNGGEGAMDDQIFAYDEVQALSPVSFTAEDYRFVGWAHESDGEVLYWDGAVVSNLTAEADGNITLYAVWEIWTTPMQVCDDAFGGAGAVALDENDNIVVTLTNDVSGTVEIPDNVGNVTIDLNGHDMAGQDGGAAIRIVQGASDGDATRLSIEDTSDGEKGQITGEGDSAGIEIAEDAASGVRLDVDEGVTVLNGDGTEQEFRPKLVGTGTVTVPKTWKTGQKVTWKAKADKGSVFARWEGAFVDSLGLSRNERRNPSLAFAVPDGFETNQVTAVFIPIDDDGLYELALTQTEFELKAAVDGVWVTDDSESYLTASVSGLPSGLKFDAKTLRITGAPTKGGVFWVQLKGKNASGYQWAENIKITVSGGGAEAKEPKLTRTAYHPVTVICATDGGTVSGTGVYAEGKKAAIKATAAKGYVFAGWYEDSRLTTPATFEKGDFRTASQNIVVPEMRYVFAQFVTAEEDKTNVALAVDGEVMRRIEDDAPYQTNVMCGVYMEWPVVVEALSLPTVTVSGLPTGLKFTAKDIVDSKTKQVTVPANTIYGTPTAASKVDAKTGVVKPSVVKVTVTTAGKAKVAYEIDVTVDAVKEWAVGTFDGSVGGTGNGEPGTGGLVTLTVSAAGKISGKLLEGGKTWTLSAANFDAYDAETGIYTATVLGKSGKEAITNEVTIVAETVEAVTGDDAPYQRGVARGDGWTAWRNPWKDEPWKTDAKPFVKAPPLTMGEITLKFAASGAVTASGKFVTGKDAKGNDVVYSASCSSVLVHAGGNAYTVYLYFPPKAGKFEGYSAEISLVWDGVEFLESNLPGEP